MAYDNQGAAIGAAGHYASVLTAALIERGDLQTDDEILASFQVYLEGTFAACEALKGDQPETAKATPARRSFGGRKSSGGSQSQDPGTVDFRGGKFAGKTIAEVYNEEEGPGYLEWCVANLKNDFMVGRIEAFLSSVAA